MKKIALLIFLILVVNFQAPASLASEPVYSDTSLPKVLNLSVSIIPEEGLPNIQIKTSIRTFKNPAKNVRVTFVSTATRSVLEPPCQAGIFTGSVQGALSNPRDINNSDAVGSRGDGDWIITDYVFKSPLNDKVNQNNYPYCRGGYEFLAMYMEDIAKHYVMISRYNGVQGGWASGIGQTSNVWDAVPSSATCPRYPGYPSDAIRSACDVNVNVLSTTFTLADSDWINATANIKAQQEAEAKAVAETRAKAEAELKAKQEAEAKAAAELKAKQEAEAKVAALKKTTITCVKGKLSKKITAIKPKCPSGYKLKK